MCSFASIIYSQAQAVLFLSLNVRFPPMMIDYFWDDCLMEMTIQRNRVRWVIPIKSPSALYTLWVDVCISFQLCKCNPPPPILDFGSLSSQFPIVTKSFWSIVSLTEMTRISEDVPVIVNRLASYPIWSQTLCPYLVQELYFAYLKLTRRPQSPAVQSVYPDVVHTLWMVRCPFCLAPSPFVCDV